MSARIVIVQDTLDFARQINSDSGLATKRAAEALCRELSWPAPTVLSDDDVPRFLEAGSLSSVDALIVPSNAARHRDGTVLQALVEHAEVVDDRIRNGMGLLILHQYTEHLIPLSHFEGVRYVESPTVNLRQLDWLSDYTSLLPNPFANTHPQPGRPTPDQQSTIAWKALKLPANGTWRPLLTRDKGTEVLAARLNRDGNAVIVSTLPADWLHLNQVLENWIYATAMGRPHIVALHTGEEPYNSSAILRWKLSEEEIDWISNPDATHSRPAIADARPLEVIFAHQSLGEHASVTIPQRGFTATEVAQLEDAHVTRLVTTQSSPMAHLGERLFRTMLTETSLIDELLTDPQKNLFPLRNILGATALLRDHSLELRADQNLIFQPDKLEKTARSLAFNGMTLSSVACATEVLALIRKLHPGDSRGAIRAAAENIGRMTPPGIDNPATRSAILESLEILTRSSNGYRGEPGLSDRSDLSADDLQRARALINFVEWACGLQPRPVDVAVSTVPMRHPAKTSGIGATEYTCSQLRATLPFPGEQPSSQDLGLIHNLVTELETVERSELSLAQFSTVALGLAWAYTHGVSGNWSNQSQRRNSPTALSSSTRDLTRIRMLENDLQRTRRLVLLGRGAAILVAISILAIGVVAAVTLTRADMIPIWAAISLFIAALLAAVEFAAWSSVLPAYFGKLRSWLRATLLERGRTAG